MQIEANIDYWGEGVACFDPEKVLNKLQDWFPELVIDPIDYSQAEVERVSQFAKDNFPELRGSVIIRQIHGKHRRNGPIYRFSIELGEANKITGYAKRYTVSFNSKDELSDEILQRIVDFLESLKLGEITREGQ